MQPRVTLLTVLVVAPLLGACSNPFTTDDAADEGAAVADTALEALDVAAAAGTDPVTLALTEFSLLVGEVPGALDIEPDASLPLSATGAVTRVVGVWDQLDEQQRDAVRQHLRPWREALAVGTTDVLADGTADGTVTMAMGAGATVLAEAPEESVNIEVRAAADHVLSTLGGERPARLQVAQASEPLAEGDAVTGAGLLTTAGGVFELIFGDTITGQDCSMVLGPRVPDLPTPMLRSLAAHEVFHCWSVVNSPSLSAHIATPEWYQEGVAAWIGEDYAGGSGYSTNWWRLWLQPATRPVTTTSYPAIGYWAWADRATSGALLGQIPELHEIAITGDDLVLYGAVVQAVDGAAVTGLAASRSRQPSWGPDWDLAGPGITADAVDADPPLPLALGSTNLDTRPGSLRTGTYARPSGDGVLGVLVAIDGHARARWSDGSELVVGGGTGDARWCVTDPCECPDGTAVLGWEALPAAAGELTVALTGGTDTSTSAVLTVEDLCDDTEPPATTEPTGDSPLLGTWRSQPSAMIAEVNTLFGDMAASADYAGGYVDLTFGADGTVVVEYVDVTLLLQPGDGLPGVPLEITGGGRLQYAIRDSTMTFGGGDWTVRFRLAGVDGDLPISDEEVPDTRPSTAVWGINQGTLTLQTDISDVFLPNQYRKP